MAGYSGTPLAKKLGIKEESKVVLVSAPDGFEGELGALPPGVRIESAIAWPTTWTWNVMFVTQRDELERRFLDVARRLKANGGVLGGVAQEVLQSPQRSR